MNISTDERVAHVVIFHSWGRFAGRKVKMISQHTLDMLYKITVRSIKDYALPVYYHSLKVTDKAKLDRIQYAAAKVVTGVRHQIRQAN